jgi:DNA replication protein DnaC
VTSIREIAPRYTAQVSRVSGNARMSAQRPARSQATAVTTSSAVSKANDRADAESRGNRTPQTPRTSRATSKASAPGVCPLCHGAGYLRLDVPMGDPAFGQAIRCTCKERQLEERDRSNLRRLSNLDPFRDKTFETFDVGRQTSLREAYDVARRYARDPLDWLVFQGGYGRGKTHLAAAIANEAERNGIPVIFAIVPELLDHLRAAFAPNSEMTYDALFDKVREVQLLVLDDFGAENSTAWATEKLFQLINYRYNYRMPTVITTNQRLLSRIDERISSRLLDRGLVHQVIIEAVDYRQHLSKPPSARRRS